MIIFHVYDLFARCAVHGVRPLDENKNLHLCLHDLASMPPEKLYTRKELVTM